MKKEEEEEEIRSSRIAFSILRPNDFICVRRAPRSVDSITTQQTAPIPLVPRAHGKTCNTEPSSCTQLH